MLASLVNNYIQDINIKDIGYEAIMGIIDRYIERDINWEDVTCLDVIGLDEISLKKGHCDFVAIITGRIETETVFWGCCLTVRKPQSKHFLVVYLSAYATRSTPYVQICMKGLCMQPRGVWQACEDRD